MQNIVQSLQHTHCIFYVLIFASTNFYIHIWESRYDKILKTHNYFQNININVVCLLNKFLFKLHSLMILYVYIHRKKIMYRYMIVDMKILKTRDYFQNININTVFLLNKFLFYMQYLHRTRCKFYVFVSQKLNFIYTVMRKLICLKYSLM